MQKSILIPLLIALASMANVAKAGEDVAYFHQGTTDVHGYLAQPSGSGPHPGIVLIHEWWGLNDDIRAKADRFAKLGYTALAVDLYNGKSTTAPTEARELATIVRSNMDVAFQNLRSGLGFLATRPGVDKHRLASIGWCFGGGWSYQIAKNNLGVKASVIYYGRFNPSDDLSKMRAEIIGHFAGKDRGIRTDKVNEFQAKLNTLHGEHEIYIYPNTSHGFAGRKGTNSGYDDAAAKLAWKRTEAFLHKHL